MKFALLFILALTTSTQTFAEDTAAPAPAPAEKKEKKPKSARRIAVEKKLMAKAKEYTLMIAIRELNAILTSTDDSKLNPVALQIKKKLNSTNLENSKAVVETLKEVVGDKNDARLDLVSRQIDKVLALVIAAEENDEEKFTQSTEDESKACLKYLSDRGISKNGEFFTQLSSDDKSLRNYTDNSFNECDSKRVTCSTFTAPKRMPAQHHASRVQFAYYSSYNKESLLKNVFGKDYSDSGVKNPPIDYKHIVSRDRCVKLLLGQDPNQTDSDSSAPAKSADPGSAQSGG